MLSSTSEIEFGIDDFASGDEAIAANRDKYGRLLGHIYIDGLHLNHELIRLGFSPYFNKYGSSRLYDSDFRVAQAGARRQGLMIWNAETNQGAASRNYNKLLPWWERRAAAIDLARYSSVNGESLNDSGVNGGKRIFICDNECHLIGTKSTRWQNFSVGNIVCLVDFQLDITRKFSKGWVVQQKTKNFLVRFFFSSSFLESSSNLSTISQLVEEKDYGFVSGQLKNYRGTTQVNVTSIASTPFDLN